MNCEKKKQVIAKLEEFVNSPITGASAFAGLNMCDIYLNIKDREFVLSTIQDRYPHATGHLDSAEDWADKLQSLKTNKTYISGFAGQLGEIKALETLNKMGIKTKPFESRIHENEDLQSLNGGPDWSVKSYKEISNFKSIVKDHPDSDHYVVNSELFDKLKDSGELEEYGKKGIVIIDGHFNHDDSVELAKERLESITGNILDEINDGLLDDIPIVAGIVTLCNIGINIQKYQNGNSSKDEAYKEVIKGIGKISASSGGAAMGAALGASIGSAIFPLAGTVIGSGVGALIGSIGAREIVDNFALNWKWGNSKKAYKYYCNKYRNGFSNEIEKFIKINFFRLNSIKQNLEVEKSRLMPLKDEINIESQESPTLKAVLLAETIKRLEYSINEINLAIEHVFKQVTNFCCDYGIAKFPRQREKAKDYALLLFGAMIAENHQLLFITPKNEEALLKNMEDELSCSPNNPFNLKHSKQEIFAALAISTLKG